MLKSFTLRCLILLVICTSYGLSAPTSIVNVTLPTDSVETDEDEIDSIAANLNKVCLHLKYNQTTVEHPKNCALYYNCSKSYEEIPQYMEQNLYECPYPKLFSSDTGKCENPDNVKCGKRKEPKWECQYRQHWCKREDCPSSKPCASVYPTCIGKADGNNAFLPEQKMLPYYIVCQNERVYEIKFCPRVPERMVFSPISKRCARLFEIPIEYNDVNGVCKQKKNGYHPDVYGRCKNYFRCHKRRFVAFKTCPGSEVFDTISGICNEPEDVCGPCGTGKSKCKKSKETELETDGDKSSTVTKSATTTTRSARGIDISTKADGIRSTVIQNSDDANKATTQSSSVRFTKIKSDNNPSSVTQSSNGAVTTANKSSTVTVTSSSADDK